MSTYLQLAVLLRQKALDSGTGPSGVTGQTGQLARLVQWIPDAWEEMQKEHDDWLWMRRSFTVQTVASDGEYAYTDCTDATTSAVIARFSHWYKDWFQCYLTSSGVGAEYRLKWVEWDAFKSRYHFGAQNDGPPEHVSVNPARSFVLGPEPDAIYTVTGDFQLAPQVLAANGDTPEFPSEFHRLIVYEALMKYGLNSVAPEKISSAQIESRSLRSALTRQQRPKIRLGCSLV